MALKSAIAEPEPKTLRCRAAGSRGVDHHSAAAILKRLEGQPLNPPTLLGPRLEPQQAKRQRLPALGPAGVDQKQQDEPGFVGQGRDRGQGFGELGVAQASGHRPQGWFLPAQESLAAGMGEQGSAEHQPVGLPQHLMVFIEPLPAPRRGDAQVAHQGSDMQLDTLARQLQQSLAELIHPASASEKPTLHEAIARVGMQSAFSVELGEAAGPGFDPAALQQRRQQSRLRARADVEQGSSVVDAPPAVTAGATGAGPTTRAPPGFPDRQVTGPAQPPQLGHERAAGDSGTDHRQLIGGRSSHQVPPPGEPDQDARSRALSSAVQRSRRAYGESRRSVGGPPCR